MMGKERLWSKRNSSGYAVDLANLPMYPELYDDTSSEHWRIRSSVLNIKSEASELRSFETAFATQVSTQRPRSPADAIVALTSEAAAKD